MMWNVVLLISCLCNNIINFIPSINAQDGVNFPDQGTPAGSDASNTALTRQGIQNRIFPLFHGPNGPFFPGIPPGPLPGPPGAPPPPFPQLPPLPQFPQPNIVTPPVQTTCVCAPVGTCNGTLIPPTAPTDGSGQIDIRIVTNPSPGTPIITPPPAPPITCAANLAPCCNPGPYQCGVRYPPIIGSVAPGPGQAPYGSYPWQAVLLGAGDVYQGSGVLLDPLNVLTVAHRVTQFVAAPNTLKVRMGEWNASGTSEPLPAQEFIVSRITINPNFNGANLKNDVAILRLATPVPLGPLPTIATGCLPLQSFVGTRCWVSGWGRDAFVGGTFQTIQKQVDVPILANPQCQSQLSGTRLGPAFVFDTTSFICAGGEIGKDACTGDGGSPLVCQLNGRWYVAGLVAWGIGCGTTNIPGVYVNVATFVPWIQSIIAS